MISNTHYFTAWLRYSNPQKMTLKTARRLCYQVPCFNWPLNGVPNIDYQIDVIAFYKHFKLVNFLLAQTFPQFCRAFPKLRMWAPWKILSFYETLFWREICYLWKVTRPQSQKNLLLHKRGRREALGTRLKASSLFQIPMHLSSRPPFLCLFNKLQQLRWLGEFHSY